jgi:acyl-CoA-dependent ceramide synthase
MKWQIFIPIALLQMINLFWYFLIWRILIRAIFSANLADERSDDEEDEDPEPSTEKKAKSLKGGKAE